MRASRVISLVRKGAGSAGETVVATTTTDDTSPRTSARSTSEVGWEPWSEAGREIAIAKRLLAGVEPRTETLALELFDGIGFRGDFLKQRATRDLFALEQHIPSKVIDRDSTRGWQQSGSLDTWARARERTSALLEAYEPPAHDPARLAEVRQLVEGLAQDAGMDRVPEPG